MENKPDNKCDDCGKVDIIEHDLFYCINCIRSLKQFWNQLKTWMVDNLGFGIELTVCEVLFVLPTYNNPDLKLTYFLIIIGKWFLNNA